MQCGIAAFDKKRFSGGILRLRQLRQKTQTQQQHHARCYSVARHFAPPFKARGEVRLAQ